MGKRRATAPGDVILIHLKGQPATFARVERIRPHERAGWHYCDLLLLAAPPQPISWILREEQIEGEDFTMGGEPIRLERLPDPGALPEPSTETGAASSAAPGRPAAAGPARKRPKRSKRDNVVTLFPTEETDEPGP